MALPATVKPDGDAIRARRIRCGLSTVQLGEKIGRPSGTIRNLELGYRRASGELINAVALGLGVQPEDIIERESAA
jgi:transcriptional regulator with XRE-family HTH domain